MKFKSGLRNSVCFINHTNQFKKKNHMIILTDTKKLFDKIQSQILIKTKQNLEIKGELLNLIK